MKIGETEFLHWSFDGLSWCLRSDEFPDWQYETLEKYWYLGPFMLHTRTPMEPGKQHDYEWAAVLFLGTLLLAFVLTALLT